MTIKLGVVMDPIDRIHVEKDTSLALMLEAERRGWTIYYFELQDLFARDGIAYGHARGITVKDDLSHWFQFTGEATIPLSEFDIIIMRKEPPFNEDYLYATQLLELAEQQGVLVSNKPRALRDYNEKLFTLQFPKLCAPMLVSAKQQDLLAFYREYKDIVVKPLDGMGGQSIFRIKPEDTNLHVILETLTHYGCKAVMAQRYIPEIRDGDKRVHVVHGKPFRYGLCRIPQPDEARANLDRGGQGVVFEVNDHDRELALQVGEVLTKQGIHFAGLDIIGNYLSEINITSPTGTRQVDKAKKTNIAGEILTGLEQYL